MQHTAHHGKPHSAAQFAHPTKTSSALGITPGMTVADFGAGSGAYVFSIAQELAHSGHVYAIDVQRDLLRRIHTEAHKRGFKNISVIWADLEQSGSSKLAERSVDLVLVSNILFQLTHKKAIFEEARRILKPGGKLALIDWADSFRSMGPIREHVVTKDRALELARESSFEQVREFPAGAHHYGLLLRPKAIAV